MRSLLDAMVEIIQRELVQKGLVAIFGPDYAPQGGVVSADRCASLVTSEGTAARVTDSSSWATMDPKWPWTNYWRQMGVDDPVAAARVCMRRAGGVEASMALASERFRSAGRVMAASVEATRAGFAGFAGRQWPVVVCALGRWPAHRVEIEPVTLDLTYGGVKVQEKVVKYIIRVDGKEIGTVDQYIVET